MSLLKYIGSGNVSVAQLDTSYNPKKFTDLGEAPMVDIDPQAEFAESFATSKNQPNRRDIHQMIKPDLQVNLTLAIRQLLNLEMAVYGETSSETAGSYTGNEAFPTGIVANETYLIPGGHVGVSSLVIKDSAGSPVTVDPSKYSVNADAPLVTFLDVAGFTQPFKAFSYSYVAADKLKIMSKQTPDLCVIVDGKNLVGGSTERWFTRLYRISFKPASKLSVKSGSNAGTGNEFALFELQGVPLVVPNKDEFGEQRIY